MSIYLEKDIFKINDFIPSLIQWSTNFFYQLSPIAIIKTLPPIAFFNSVIENADIINILVNIPRLFLQSIHGINRAFNSETYDNLYTRGSQLLNGLEDETYLYQNVVKAYNNTLDIKYLETVINQTQPPINGNLGQSPSLLMNQWQEESVQLLFDTFNRLQGAIATLSGKLRRTAQNAFYRVKKTLEKVSQLIGFSFNGNNSRELKNFILNPLRITNYERRTTNYELRSRNGLTLTNPSMVAIVDILNEIAQFFLQSFLFAPVSPNLLPALSHTVTSIVLKYLGSGGAIASNYFAGHVLRANAGVLPVVFRATGMGGMAWTFLSAFAPWIIIAAIIIITGIKSNQKLGEHLYLFGMGGEMPDMSYLILEGSNNEEIYETIVNQGEKMKMESGKNYPHLYGFSVYQDKVVYGVDIADEQRILTKLETEMNFYPYRSLIDNFFGEL